MLYRIADIQGETEQSVKHLQTILKNTQILQTQTKSISTDVLIAEENILYTLALNYIKLQQFKIAIDYLNKALEINPEKYEIREKLIETCLQREKWQDVILHIQYLIQQFPQDDKYMELLGTVLIKQQLFSEAIQIYENMIIKNPHNKHTVKKLIGLYGKTGELQKAHGLMQMIS
jgi:tetratricopeptide (TPR) repeat protein